MGCRPYSGGKKAEISKIFIDNIKVVRQKLFEITHIAFAKSFFRSLISTNPPYPPFNKGGNYKELLLKSPFEKGGLRGI
jgi:hypothetical protein